MIIQQVCWNMNFTIYNLLRQEKGRNENSYIGLKARMERTKSMTQKVSTKGFNLILQVTCTYIWTTLLSGVLWDTTQVDRWSWLRWFYHMYRLSTSTSVRIEEMILPWEHKLQKRRILKIKKNYGGLRKRSEGIFSQNINGSWTKS